MIEALPRRAFFRFELPILRREFGVAAADVKKWDAAYMLPALVEVEDEAPLADVYAGWSPEGMHFLFDVPERTTPLSCDPKQWYKKDGLRICIDTRDTRDARDGDAGSTASAPRRRGSADRWAAAASAAA